MIWIQGSYQMTNERPENNMIYKTGYKRYKKENKVGKPEDK
jgi:hypothetical protein